MQELSSDFAKYQARERNLGDKYAAKSQEEVFESSLLTLDSFEEAEDDRELEQVQADSSVF